MTPTLDGCRCRLCNSEFDEPEDLLEHDCPEDRDGHSRVLVRA